MTTLLNLELCVCVLWKRIEDEEDTLKLGVSNLWGLSLSRQERKHVLQGTLTNPESKERSSFRGFVFTSVDARTEEWIGLG